MCFFTIRFAISLDANGKVITAFSSLVTADETAGGCGSVAGHRSRASLRRPQW
jgi:hypothetical protein